MMRTVYGSAVAVVLALSGCRGWETEERPVHPIKNMDTQEKGRAYRRDSTGLFADGRLSRLPVEGTVAVGQLGDDAHLEDGLDEQGNPSMTYPAAIKEKLGDGLRAHGKTRYEIYCAPCHGPALDGKGPVAGKALDGGPRLEIPPPSFHDARLKEMVVGKLYGAIKNGVNAGNMASYAAQIPVEDRWALVAYIRGEQMKKDPAVQEEGGAAVVAVNVTAASAEAGAALYKAKGCNACHSLDGTRVVGPTFKGMWGSTHGSSAGPVTVEAEYFKESLLNPMAKVAEGYPPAMPPQALNDLEIESLALYLQTLK